MAAMAQGAQKMDVDEASASDIDRVSIESMSFCPTKPQVAALIAKANQAEAVRIQLKGEGGDWRSDKTGAKGQKLLSKLYFLPGKFGLCPDSLEPDDTILAKLGRGDIGPGGLPGQGALRVINDRNMPFGSTSCGPNGVLAICNGRINLFYGDMASTKGLLDQYISFRNAHLHEIFGMFVKKIQTMAGTMKLDPSKDATLSGDLQTHYNKVASMFSKVLANCKNSGDLARCGIGCNSFCQTWLRNGGDVGNAQFSVMSPHFQTRFHVINDEALMACGVTQDEIESYVTIISHFNGIMGKDYGVSGGGQAFVNLDKLHTLLKTVSGGKKKTRRRRRKRKTKRKTKKRRRKRKRKRKKTKKRRR